MKTVGILAYGSLIQDPGSEIRSVLTGRKERIFTPFNVEFARKSRTHNYAPTLIPVQNGGSKVSAHILVLSEGTEESQAKDLLWRRETHQIGTGKKYPNKKKPGPNDVVIERIENFQGIDIVLYTKIASNIGIEQLTPQALAQLAIDSATPEMIIKNLDGISYLKQVKNDGIKTPLMDDYEREILSRFGARDLDACLLKVLSSHKEKGTDDEAKLLGLFGHFSRMYNSTINALIAVIFGWATLIGLVLSLIANDQFTKFWIMLPIMAIFIILMAIYLFARTLQFDRYIAKLAFDFNLENYLYGLPKVWLLSRINKRTKDNINGWTLGQKVALILMICFFAFPLAFLLYKLTGI
jgi:hypothetical protein